MLGGIQIIQDELIEDLEEVRNIELVFAISMLMT